MVEEGQIRVGASIPLWFSVPQAFTQLQLTEEPLVRAERTIDQLARTFPGITGEQRRSFLLAQQHLVDQLIENETAYAATMLAKGDREEDSETRLTMAMFTVMVQELDVPAAEALYELSEKLRNPNIHRDVGWLGLPAGQALVVAEDRQGTPEETVFGDPADTLRYFRQLQLTLSFPDRRRIATFTICTENLTDWDDYTDIFGAIARTISFTRPRPPQAEDRHRRSLTSELNAATTFNRPPPVG